MKLPKLLRLDTWHRKNREARRDPRAVSRPKPGTLQNSIDFSVGDDMTATVFISGFGGASEYAGWMHSGEPPYNLGPGSVRHQAASGCEVGPGFLTRAGEESEAQITKIIDRNIQEAFRKGKLI